MVVLFLLHTVLVRVRTVCSTYFFLVVWKSFLYKYPLHFRYAKKLSCTEQRVCFLPLCYIVNNIPHTGDIVYSPFIEAASRVYPKYDTTFDERLDLMRLPSTYFWSARNSSLYSITINVMFVGGAYPQLVNYVTFLFYDPTRKHYNALTPSP